MTDRIILIVGPSGSGKTTVADILEHGYGLKQLYSYTTREPRYEGEVGHRFASMSDWEDTDEQDVIAWTIFNDNYYWATKAQVEECDVYVIDRLGIRIFAQSYSGPKKPYVVALSSSRDVSKRRMLCRGDTPERVSERLDHDWEFYKLPFWRIYSGIHVDQCIDTDDISPEEVAKKIMEAVK